jgi:hypothetical protein
LHFDFDGLIDQQLLRNRGLAADMQRQLVFEVAGEPALSAASVNTYPE